MIHQIGLKVRAQIHGFSRELCYGLGKVASRFVEEMIYGIQARGSVRLSEIARSLGEGIKLKKVIDRLSRNLRRAKLWEHIGEAVLNEGAVRIARDSLLIVDLTDITKKYARKMECLARVRDGSEKVLGRGYWVCTVVGAEVNSQEIIPLVHKLYSQEATDFKSENQEMMEAVRSVYKATEGRGILVLDRGGDRGCLYKEFLGQPKPYRFIVRQKGDRHILYHGRKQETLILARECKTPYSETIIKEKDGQEKPYFIEFGFRPVRLPEYPGRQLWLVVVKGFGEQPLMLLTNEPMRRNRKVLWRLVRSYITRWKVEETIRFIKQSYNLEDVRVLTYERLRNISALVLAASFFATAILGAKAKLEILALHVMEAAGRIFGLPNFRYYALADGIKEILTLAARGILRPQPRDCSNNAFKQMPLFQL